MTTFDSREENLELRMLVGVRQLGLTNFEDLE